ncbi:hypothetical protein GCM10010429_58410 [Micromonospora olivasterospora]
MKHRADRLGGNLPPRRRGERAGGPVDPGGDYDLYQRPGVLAVGGGGQHRPRPLRVPGDRRVEHVKGPRRGPAPISAAVLVDDHRDAGCRIRLRGERRDLRPGQGRSARGHHQWRPVAALGQGDGLQGGPGHYGPAGAFRLFGEAEHHLRRPEHRRGGAV